MEGDRMTEVKRIDDQLQRAFEGEAWHGPAVLEVLKGVTAAQAAARPIPSAHSIWELVLHMATWKNVVSRRLRGESVTDVPAEVDWPPVPATGKSEWEAAQARLREAHQDLRRTLATVKDEELEANPAPETSTRYVLLHGVIQHDLYHAGQIAVLKKG
jgi:uncharacterized damage-inducible protein DinB